jgi:hypothetical protein
MPSSSGICIKTVISSFYSVLLNTMRERIERIETDFEEHEITGKFGNTVLQGDTFSDSPLLREASPAGETRGIH